MAAGTAEPVKTAAFLPGRGARRNARRFVCLPAGLIPGVSRGHLEGGGSERGGMGQLSAREIALGNEILRGIVGSTVNGTAIDDQADWDELGVFIEPADKVCGLESLDHYIRRDQPEGVRSGPGDVDLTLYSLRRFCRLAITGNAGVLMLLWLPAYVTRSEAGDALVRLRDAFVSRKAGERFVSYLVSQRKRLTGESGLRVKRPELVARHGYDTKFAMHALRVGYQGIALMADGRLPVPVSPPELAVLRAVRAGEIPYADVLGLIAEVEARLKRLVEACERQPDIPAVEAFLVEAHLRHWGAVRAS
jgi:predicted nucleotidyltransferase